MSKLIDTVLESWRSRGARPFAVVVAEGRASNYFGQRYCPECQKAGRDRVLNESADRRGLVCAAGHAA